MKIAVASDGPGLESSIPDLFAKSPYLLILKPETGEILHVAAHDDGQDMAFAREILRWDCEGVLCGPIEREPFIVIADEGCVTRYNAAGMTTLDALNAFAARTLPLIRDYIGGTGCQEGGGGDCTEHHHDHREA